MAVGNESNDSSKDDRVDLEKILAEEIGEGRYQIKATALCGLLAFLVGFTSNDFIFFAERVKTRCKIDECEDQDVNCLSPPWLADAVPAIGKTFDSCHRFALSNSRNSSADGCHPSLFNKSSIVECTEYVYQHKNTAVYEFGLACDEWRWYLFGSSVVIGMVISPLLTGFISDRWGRRFVISITAINFAWINITRYWVKSFNIFILITFLGSVCGSSTVSCCFLLALELVSSKRRMLVASILTTCVVLGGPVKALVASTQPYWRDFILMLYMPLFISISYFWIAPESIRWLMSKNRFEEARDLLVKAANMNGRVLSDKTAKEISECTRKSEVRNKEESLICLLFKYKTILLRSIIISTWILTTSFTIRGIAVSSVSISGNKYMNYAAVAAFTIPGCWICTFFINKVGRKPLLAGLFLITGSCSLGYIFVPKGTSSNWMSISLYTLAQSSAFTVLTLIVVYTAEVLPTSHRSRLEGFIYMFGKVGDLVGLLTPFLMDRVWENLPHALFTAMAIFCSLLVLLTPETLGVPLPDTVEDATQLGQNQFRCSLLRRPTVKKDQGPEDHSLKLSLSVIETIKVT